jgi:hypothetical protein
LYLTAVLRKEERKKERKEEGKMERWKDGKMERWKDGNVSMILAGQKSI